MDGFGYIYKTTNMMNGRIYIGQKTGTFTPSYLGSGLEIIRAVRKYGRKSFRVEIVGYASDKESLNSLERRTIEQYRTSCGRTFLYNIADGGQGGDFGCSLKGEDHPNWGKKFSDETKDKLRSARRRRVTLETTKQKLSLSFSGDKNPFFGKKHNEETRMKISMAKFGKTRRQHKDECLCCVCRAVRMKNAEPRNVLDVSRMS